MRFKSLNLGVALETCAHGFARIALVAVTLACVVAGCEHVRVTTITRVDDVGPVVETRNRYTCAFVKQDARGSRTICKNADLNAKLMAAQPRVFGEDGIPFEVKFLETPERLPPVWTKYMTILSLCTLPVCENVKWDFRYSINVFGNQDACCDFQVNYTRDSAFALFTPSPLLCYIGDIGLSGVADGHKVTKHRIECCGSPVAGDAPDRWQWRDMLTVSAAYGIAMCLKKMEDAGKIGLPRNMEASQDGRDGNAIDRFDIVDFTRDKEDGYWYSFVLKIREGELVLRDARNVQKDLRRIILRDYESSFPIVPQGLRVNFVEYSFESGQIRGRAVVLMLNVLSVEYDPHSRRGNIRIRIMSNQLADVRAYLKGNLEMIVRDKNIALEVGKLPPSATYYQESEKIIDDILEINFRTE